MWYSIVMQSERCWLPVYLPLMSIGGAQSLTLFIDFLSIPPELKPRQELWNRGSNSQVVDNQ
jgi:hypothetical protein